MTLSATLTRKTKANWKLCAYCILSVYIITIMPMLL
jgi:hypothetical protein